MVPHPASARTGPLLPSLRVAQTVEESGGACGV